MKRIALLLAATAFTAPALAADVIYEEPMMAAPAPIAVAPVASGWTGLYVGLQGGGAFNPSDPDDLGLNSSFGTNTPIVIAPGTTFAPANSGFAANTIGAAFGDNFDSSFESGFVGGAHLGYDFQFDRVVVGGIVDINATDVSIVQSADSNTPADYTAERQLEYLATARLRAGYLITPTVLAYATGGLAYGEIDYSFSTDSPAVTGNARSAATARDAIVNEDEEDFGYSIGGGMEVKITDNLSFGAEYLYTDLGGGDSSTRLDGGPFDGSNTNAGATTGEFTDFESTGDFDFHTITAKLSYRFN